MAAQDGGLKGRTVEGISGFSDAEIEYTHDFIQIIFPEDKPSQSALSRARDSFSAAWE